VSTVHDWNHNHPLTRVVADSAGIMTDDSAPLHPSPLSAVEVQVGSADASCFKVDKNAAAVNLWFGDLLDFNMVRSMINCGFQKNHYTYAVVGRFIFTVFISRTANYAQSVK